MKKLIQISAMLMLSALLFVACDEDDDNNDPDNGGNNGGTTEQNYFPITTGDYRVYQNYDVDNSGNKTESTIDSNAVTEQGNFDGNDTYTEKEYEWDEANSEYNDRDRDVTYYENEGVIYASAGLIASLSTVEFEGQNIALPINIQDGTWVPIVDFSANSTWNVYTDNSIVGESLQVPGFPVAVEFTQPLSVDGSNMGTETIEVNGTQYEAVKVNWTISSQVGLSGATADLTVQLNNYYADGIGLVKSEQIPFSLKANVFGQEVGEDFPGNESILIRYNIQSEAEVN